MMSDCADARLFLLENRQAVAVVCHYVVGALLTLHKGLLTSRTYTQTSAAPESCLLSLLSRSVWRQLADPLEPKNRKIRPLAC